MNKKPHASLDGLRRAGAVAAIMLTGFALSSHYALAQATYNYTGHHYTFVSPPFTSNMSVSGVLQFWAWLPPNQTCIDATTMPGFRLVLRDGLEAVDTGAGIVPGAVGVTALISTDAYGQITQPWSLFLLLNGTFVIIESSAVPAGSPAPCSVSGTGDSADHDIPFDNMNMAGSDVAGKWSYPGASDLAAMLTNLVDLQQEGLASLSNELKQISIDIADQNWNACSDLNVLKTQGVKNVNGGQEQFIRRTVAIMQSQLHCGS